MALAPETVKTIVTNSVTGTAGIVGTTVPSVQLSNVRAENAELKVKNTQLSETAGKDDNTEKLNRSIEISKFFGKSLQRFFKYHSISHTEAFKGKNGIDNHVEEAWKIDYCVEQIIEKADWTFFDKCKEVWPEIEKKWKIDNNTSEIEWKSKLNLSKYEKGKNPFEETTPTLEP